jgi:hypothetical protein
MRVIQILSILMAIVLGSAAAGAQTLVDSPQPAKPLSAHAHDGGWNRVRAFSQGDKIAVTTLSGETYRCTVTVPSETSLGCTYLRGMPAEQDYEFAQDEILEVRQRHPVRDIAITTGIISTLAFVGGGRQAGSSFNVQLGGISAMVAGLLSVPITVPIAMNSPGHLIYLKPGTPTGFHSWRPAPIGVFPFFQHAPRY